VITLTITRQRIEIAETNVRDGCLEAGIPAELKKAVKIVNITPALNTADTGIIHEPIPVDALAAPPDCVQ
jgi:hypothetical protein